MAKVIGFCNQKGGTGKTTSIVNLASFFALANKKVLVIDFDPQANATSGLGLERSNLGQTVYEALINKEKPSAATYLTSIRNLFLIPATSSLAGAEIELVGLEEREFHLRDLISRIEEEFDFILIDAPPSLGILTINVLTAASSVIIPIQCEYYALEGVSRLYQTLSLVKERLNPGLEIEGILLTMADFRARLTFQVIDEVRNFFKDKVYGTVIPRNTKLSEAPSFGKPVYFYDPLSVGSRAYFNLSCEILNQEIKGVYDGEESIGQRAGSVDTPQGHVSTVVSERVHLY